MGIAQYLKIVTIIFLLYLSSVFGQSLPQKIYEYQEDKVSFHVEYNDREYKLFDTVLIRYRIVNHAAYSIYAFNPEYYKIPSELNYAEKALINNRVRLGGDWEPRLGYVQNILLIKIAPDGKFDKEFKMIVKKTNYEDNRALCMAFNLFTSKNLASVYFDIGYINCAIPIVDLDSPDGWADITKNDIWFDKNLHRFVLGPFLLNIK